MAGFLNKIKFGHVAGAMLAVSAGAGVAHSTVTDSDQPMIRIAAAQQANDLGKTKKEAAATKKKKAPKPTEPVPFNKLAIADQIKIVRANGNPTLLCKDKTGNITTVDANSREFRTDDVKLAPALASKSCAFFAKNATAGTQASRPSDATALMYLFFEALKTPKQ